MAHIQRRRKAEGHYWQVRYVDPKGAQHARNFVKRADAERFVTTMEADVLRGAWIDPSYGRTPLAEWAERWL